MSRLFALLHSFVWNRPRGTVALLLLSCALAGTAASRLEFTSDIEKILPADSPAVESVGELLKHFSFTGEMFLFFERQDPAATDAAAMRLADELGRRLEVAPEVKGVEWKLRPETEKFLGDLVSSHGPLLLGDAEMERFLKRLEPAEVRATVRRNRRRLQQPAIGVADFLVEKDPLDLTRDFFFQALSAGRPAGAVDLQTGYYFSRTHDQMLMVVAGKEPPHDVAFSKALVERTEAAMSEARAAVPEAAGWKISMLGGYPIALQSESTIRSDLRMNLLTSIPPVLLMLLISLRRWAGLAMGAVALAIGILWTFGVAGAIYGHLTAVTVGFAGILAGLGIDFTIHIFHRYRHERLSGLPPFEASLRTYTGTGPGAFIAMITTAFSILCLWVSSFRGLRGFGTLVGVGTFLVFFANLVVIPLFNRLEPAHGAPREVSRWVSRLCWVLFCGYFALSIHVFTWLGLAIAASCVLLMTGFGEKLMVGLVVGRPRFTALLAALTTLVSFAALSRPPIGLPEREDDVTNLRTEGDTVLETQERLRQAYQAGSDPILVLLKAGSEDEALEKSAAVTAALDGLPASSVQSVTQFIPPVARQERQAARLAGVDAGKVIRDLDAALDAEGFDTAAFDGARAWLRGLLAARDPIRPSDVTDPFFSSIRGRYLSRDATGEFRCLVWFVPLSALHDRHDREAAVEQLRAVASAASPGARLSGFSVVVKEIDDLIGPDIFWSTLAGGGVSILLAWILYGSFRWMAVSIFPAIIGTFWFIACLKLMGMKMNYLNLIVFPILAGLATDNGLYLVERFREVGQRSARDTVAPLWSSLSLVSLATTVGFGSLAFSANRAMRSLGIAISVGMLCYLYASVLVLPPILKWLETGEKGPGEPPHA